MTSAFSQHLSRDPLLAHQDDSQTADDGRAREQPGGEEIAAMALRKSVRVLKKMGKRVVVVAPPPSGSGVDIGRCLKLRAEG